MSDNKAPGSNKVIVVVGGGIAGITAALEAAEVGHEVILVEKEAYLGGRVVRMNQYFPKLCPPTCGLEVNYQRIRSNPRLTVHTLAEVVKVSGERGDYEVTIKVNPRYVTGNAPISQSHLDAVTTEVPDAFNAGMSKVKALRLPHDQAFPPLHVLDANALGAEEKAKLEAAEPKGAIDLNQEAETLHVKAAAIIVATGWQPYDADKLETLGYSGNADVITNLEMERLAARTGPTEGKITRPSDGEAPARIAFVQCAGSRDENHLPYCSAVCCMGTLKQARYVREALPEAKVTIFYIDIRTIGRYESFYYDLLEDENITFFKGKVAEINKDGKEIVCKVEDTIGGGLHEEKFDMVVLATGVVPSNKEAPIPGANVSVDQHKFIIDGEERIGIYSAGCARKPGEVSGSVKEATAAALRAIQDARR